MVRLTRMDFLVVVSDNVTELSRDRVFVLEWCGEILSMVRLHVLVSLGSTGGDYDLSRHAVHRCVDQELYFFE